MKDLILKFVKTIQQQNIEIYNEFSLQHELGIFLRSCFPNNLVQFERNISYFGFNKSDFVKKEIDISIFDKNKKNLQSILELKFPRNGQHPEQMFSFCKDIVFIEQLKQAGFKNAYFIVFADDPLFYSGNGSGIYGYFRSGIPLNGVIQKPTGKRDNSLNIKGNYVIKWHSITGTLKYAVIEV